MTPMTPDERAAIVEARIGELHNRYPYGGVEGVEAVDALDARAFAARIEVLYAEDLFFSNRSANNALLLEAAEHFEEVCGQDLDYAKECMG